jgi:hypothetical protein
MKAVMSFYLRISLLFAILLSGIVSGEVIKTSNGAGADTYLNYWGTSTNYGSETGLAISKNCVPYVKFDLGIIGPNDISDANLTFYGTPDPNNPPTVTQNFNVYGLIDGSDGWGEDTITYNNAPLVMNPIVRHPLLVLIGTLNYTPAGNEGLITMAKAASGVPAGAFINFLNDRGPDGLVTIIIASGSYDTYIYFSTKEDHGDASEAPYLTIITVSPAVVERNNWTGTDSNSWSDPDNWLDESNSTSVPDSNAVVNLVSGSHYPVIIDSNSYAKKVFVQDGNLNILSGTLAISGGVLRVKDSRRVNIVDGQIVLSGNVEGQMWGLIGKGKIITTKTGLYEVYAQYDRGTGNTVVKPRKLLRKLIWGGSIIEANGPLGYEDGGYPAHCCVDGSGMLAEAHIGYVDGTGYYCKTLYWDEPTIKFVFDKIHNLTNMFVWNYEDTYKGYGLKKVQIEYSTNDITYTTLCRDINDPNDANDPNFFTFLPGNSDCTKDDIISFSSLPVKYLKLTARGGPGTGSYEYGSTWGRYILKELQLCHEGMEASNPNPANNAQVEISLSKLVWLPGNGAVTGQDVWFGTDPNNMTKIKSNIAPEANSADVSNCESGKRYYWRVDGLNTGGSTTTGDVWNFLTRTWLHWNPTGEGVVYGYGSSGVSGSPGQNAVNESGMTGNLHAPFLFSNGWYCRWPWNLVPPIVEPELYIKFDKAYDINEMWVWNHDGNSAAEAPIAMKTVKIQYSLDDVNYTTLMNGSEANFVLPHGNTDGTHDTEIKFGVPARYIKFTAVGGPGVGNYGSTDWGYKLRELRFYHDGVYVGPKANYPEPPEGQEVDIFVELKWWPGDNAVTGQDIWLGKVGGSMVKIASNISPDVNSYTLPQLDNLSDYKWRVDSLNGAVVTQGDEWHFSTRARLRWNSGLIGVVDANGSPGEAGTDGYLAANESGLDYDLHAGFLWSNGWYCRNPWNVGITEPVLRVTFDRIYDINEMWIWNHDGTTAAETIMAMKTVKVEYSLDNVNYTTLMNGSEPNFVLPHGDPNGPHDTEIGFGNVSAKYVKITAVGGPGIGNYGSSTSPGGYKLREVRFFYQVPLWADLNHDKTVNFKDYAIMAEDWLEENWIYEPVKYCLNKPAGDITGDCKVDYLDIKVLVQEWLESIN